MNSPTEKLSGSAQIIRESFMRWSWKILKMSAFRHLWEQPQDFRTNGMKRTLSTGLLLCVWTSSSSVDRCSSFHCSGSSAFGGSETNKPTHKNRRQLLFLVICWVFFFFSVSRRATFNRRVPVIFQSACDTIEQARSGRFLKRQIRRP